VAWLASLAEDGCEYAKVSGGPDSILGSNGFNVLDGVDNPPPLLEIGFSGWRHPIYYPDESDEGQGLGVWKANVSGSCLMFPTVTVDRTNSETGDIDITTLFSPDMLMDTSWQTSKIFAFLSLVFGGGGALFLWFSSCFVFGPGSWRIAGYELLLAFVFQSLAFVWFNTSICSGSATSASATASATLTTYNNNNCNNTCSLFVGSRTDIMATVFWLVSAISIFYKYPTPSSAAGINHRSNNSRNINNNTNNSNSSNNNNRRPTNSNFNYLVYNSNSNFNNVFNSSIWNYHHCHRIRHHQCNSNYRYHHQLPFRSPKITCRSLDILPGPPRDVHEVRNAFRGGVRVVHAEHPAPDTEGSVRTRENPRGCRWWTQPYGMHTVTSTTII
jgi:hypothetical protein